MPTFITLTMRPPEVLWPKFCDISVGQYFKWSEAKESQICLKTADGGAVALTSGSWPLGKYYRPTELTPGAYVICIDAIELICHAR